MFASVDKFCNYNFGEDCHNFKLFVLQFFVKHKVLFVLLC